MRQTIDPANLNVLGFPRQRLDLDAHRAGDVRKVRQVHDGEWVRPVMTGYIMECCGCGLQHRMDFRVTPERGLEMRGFRIEYENTDDV
jgi:hypothetical protein